MTVDDAGDSNFTQNQGNISGENEAFVQCPEGSENAIFCAYLNSTVWEEVRLLSKAALSRNRYRLLVNKKLTL